MSFQQAQIPVQNREHFEQLKSAMERAFSSATVEKLLKKFQSSNVRVRRLEEALDKKVFESVDPALGESGKTAKEIYESLSLSDQAMIREFYLERLERVDAKLRSRFQKIY